MLACSVWPSAAAMEGQQAACKHSPEAAVTSSLMQVGGKWLGWWIVPAAAALQNGQFQAEKPSSCWAWQGCWAWPSEALSA